MIQKIIKVGNSLGVTINKKHLKILGLSIGDYVQLTYNLKAGIVRVTPVIKKQKK